ADIDECERSEKVCDPLSDCKNTIGSFLCVCWDGYEAQNPKLPTGLSNKCKGTNLKKRLRLSFFFFIDINECLDTNICGDHGDCANDPGSYMCECDKGFDNEPDPKAVCQGKITLHIQEKPFFTITHTMTYVCFIFIHQGNNSQMCSSVLLCALFFTDIDECSETPGICGKLTICTNVEGTFYCSCPDGLYPSTGLLWEVGVSFCQSELWMHHHVDEMVTGLELKGVVNLHNMDFLSGSAAAAFMILKGMESLLSHQYFETENLTEMNSDVITAVLPFMNNTNLTEPVNFTIYHKKVLLIPENGLVTCVEEGEKNKMMRWSVEGCQVAYTSENYTVCSCSHLSTFALIMQIGENPFLDWLNRICVIVGLFFFGLAIFTFLLCSWNPKINNTARLHLCINLALSHLLLLWNDRYTDHELACTVMAGLLHFLVVASFVWMLLEALQLHLLVRRLSKVQVIQRDGLPKPLLYMIGYGVPFVIVGTSALIYSDGYGATEAEVCWLSRKRSFNWALTGPVIAVIGLNWILFCATLWSLKPTLVNMKSGVSQSKEIRLVVFKILAQFVILGCTWILGLYQTNLFFQVLFIFLNSQQGTFLFIVHCVLNKEVRQVYCLSDKSRFTLKGHILSSSSTSLVSELLKTCV
uniref:Adhesion G protein-coupled receptor E8 n=1 Tax=Labrus bergylta TaxID=56723 RepID=A0A3Q3E1E1_9LABR